MDAFHTIQCHNNSKHRKQFCSSTVQLLQVKWWNPNKILFVLSDNNLCNSIYELKPHCIHLRPLVVYHCILSTTLSSFVIVHEYRFVRVWHQYIEHKSVRPTSHLDFILYQDTLAAHEICQNFVSPFLVDNKATPAFSAGRRFSAWLPFKCLVLTAV